MRTTLAQVFGNTGNRVQTVCGACRKLKLSEPLPVPAGEEDVGIMAEAEPVASVTMEEIMAQPLLTASRVPSPVRARWTKIFAKLCSDGGAITSTALSPRNDRRDISIPKDDSRSI